MKFISFSRVAIIIIIFTTGCQRRPSLQVPLLLNKHWKFRLGDNFAWAGTDFNDSLWDSTVLGNKERPDLFNNYDGFAWYRTSILIPASLKKERHLKDSISFFLGKIDDCDQVYLNGMLLGENALTAVYGGYPDSNFKNMGSAWDIDRKYTLVTEDKRIHWDKLNTIAIRLFDKYGGGGIYGGMPFIAINGLWEYITIDSSTFYAVDSLYHVDKNLIFKNSMTGSPFNGTILISATNAASEKEVYVKNYSITLLPGDAKKILVDLPISTDPINIEVLAEDKETSLSLITHCLVPYVLDR